MKLRQLFFAADQQVRRFAQRRYGIADLYKPVIIRLGIYPVFLAPLHYGLATVAAVACHFCPFVEMRALIQVLYVHQLLHSRSASRPLKISQSSSGLLWSYFLTEPSPRAGAASFDAYEITVRRSRRPSFAGRILTVYQKIPTDRVCRWAETPAGVFLRLIRQAKPSRWWLLQVLDTKAIALDQITVEIASVRQISAAEHIRLNSARAQRFAGGKHDTVDDCNSGDG